MFNKEDKRKWFSDFLKSLRDFPDGEVWSNGCEILCKSEEIAEGIADLLTQLYMSQNEEVTPITGYYDPKEDKRNNEEDYCTGWYYVTLD